MTMYTLVDKLSRNIMGEFQTFEEARAALLDLVTAHPPAADDLVIFDEAGSLVSVTDVRRAATPRDDAETWLLTSLPRPSQASIAERRRTS